MIDECPGRTTCGGAWKTVYTPHRSKRTLNDTSVTFFLEPMTIQVAVTFSG